jgi:fluoride ion exporter CrcB/FEX
LGAFSKISAFGIETVSLIKEGNDFLSLANMGLQ